jgi:hypothetical protein
MGPKTVRSTVLPAEEEAMIVAFRRHTLLPLDDCLYALQATIPHLTRSSLHRCLQRHGISRLPEVAGDKPAKQPFKAYPIGYFDIDLAEVRTEEGKLYLFVAVDRTSKYAFARLMQKATVVTARAFLDDLSKLSPTKSTPCSQTTASSSPTCPRTDRVPQPCGAAIPSIGPAGGMASSIVSPSPTILGPMVRSRG